MKFVLIAESDKSHRLLLKRVFESEGFFVLEADSSVSALRILRDRPVDLIVSRTEFSDGDLLQALRSSHVSEIPFVYLASIENAHLLRSKGYLLKPVTKSRLEMKLEKLFFPAQQEKSVQKIS